MLKKLAKKAVAIFVAVEGWVDMIGLAVVSITAFHAGLYVLGILAAMWSASHVVMFSYAAYATWRS